MKFLLVDDHAVLRQGLKQILSTRWPEAIFGEAENAAGVFQALRRHTWDAMMLDLGLPDRGGLEVLREIRQEHPKLPVLVLSGQPEDQYGLRVFKAGASGFLNKGSDLEHIIEALERILNGGKYISPALAEKLAGSFAGQEGLLHATLSDREYSVLCLLGSGQTISQIAAKLSLNVKTVGTYRARLLEKMGMKTNAELTYYAIRNDLVE